MTTMQTATSVRELMGILPHRPPFLLVDRIDACTPGEYIVGVKNVTSGEPLLAPGQDGRPATFGHLLAIEALAQIAVVLAYRTLAIEPSEGDLAFFAGIDRAEFGVPAAVGDSLVLRAEVSRIKRLVGWFNGLATVRGQRVVSVSMIASIRPRG